MKILVTGSTLFLLASFFAAPLSPARAEYATAIGGIEVDGALDSLDEQGRIAIVTAKGEKSVIPATDIISIDFKNPPLAADRVGGTEFLFLNGDKLRAEVVDAVPVPRDTKELDRALEKAQEATVKSPLIGNVKVKTEHLYGFIQHSKAKELGKSPGFVERETSGKQQDWVWLANGDVQHGRIEGLMKNENGKIDMFYSVDSSRYRVGLYGIVAAKLQAFLSPDKIIPPDLAAVATLTDGSVISGGLAGVSRTTIKLKLASGQAVEIPKDALMNMSVRNGRTVYLSPLVPKEIKDGDTVSVDLSPVELLDLLPASSTNVPHMSRQFVPRKDRSYDGNPLTLGGRTFRRGIGTHSASTLTYKLDGKFERFEATIGIDSEVGRQGDVLFRVVVDGADKLPDCRLKGGDQPKKIVIPVTDAKELRLVVEYGDDFDIADHADWADACVIRKP